MSSHSHASNELRTEFLCEGCGDYHYTSEKCECELCHTSYCIGCYADMESHPCVLKHPNLFESEESIFKPFNPSKRK